MGTYVVAIGLVVRHGERTWRFEREVNDAAKTLVFVDQVTGAPRTMTLATLQRDVLAKRLVVVTGESPTLASPTARPVSLVTTLEDIAPKHRAEISRRRAYITYLHRQGLTRGQRRQIAAAIRKLQGKVPMQADVQDGKPDNSVPSTSTVMEWMRRWDLSGGSVAALMNRAANRRSSRRVHPSVLSTGREFIRTHYCQQTRPPLAETKLFVDRKLEALAAAQQIPQAAAQISMSTLQRLAKEIDPFALDLARYGPSYANNEWRYSLEGINAARVMQRYEIDHTIVDVVVISDANGMPLGRPTITVVVDSHSGYVCGFFISFWGTGLASTLSALKVAISPKGDLTEGQGLSNPWLAYGIPMMFVVDNGLEFHSPQFHSVAMHLNADLLFCAVRRPWLKPFVERTLGSYLRYLPAAGRVEKPKTNYLPLKPDKTAVVTFGALCTGLLKAFVDILPIEINQRSLSLPFDKFGDGMAKLLPPALPTSTEELDIIVAASKSLTVTGEGVVSDYLRYNSLELKDLWRATRSTFKTVVKFNPEDLSYVHVQDPRTKGWLRVPSCLPEYTDDLSLVQHRAIRERIKGELDRRKIPELLVASKLELLDMWSAQAVSGKRLKQAQLRALGGLTSAHVYRPPGRETPSATPPKTRMISVSEMEVPAFQIPAFDTLSFNGGRHV
ncbi:integrase catalytic domain-containing protein [Roseateles toxinivorans]|uniref:Putative transposase n=1 Tax=Roseateles toxinivorans TaxID=270368 RepID=A0A4R6QQZ7_9BURK|nr:DDE-type integrase/transposase/recombinase [Roseateles toxinivorans]TDP72982.1 putative transposase [Roseateles toxinivorans]